ncbi:MAG: hypothetical protein LC725_02450 [Lentisphaerae bacterium]|nr:hypothetical protein [Lentisphaerota bacterium]
MKPLSEFIITSAYEQIVTTGVYSPGGTNDDIVTSVTGHMFVAESPEAFSYDADGNLLGDGRWAYSWDAESRKFPPPPSCTMVGTLSANKHTNKPTHKRTSSPSAWI